MGTAVVFSLKASKNHNRQVDSIAALRGDERRYSCQKRLSEGDGSAVSCQLLALCPYFFCAGDPSNTWFLHTAEEIIDLR